MHSAQKTSSAAKKTPQSARMPQSARPSAKRSAKSPVVSDDLNECKYCSRTFFADSLQRHESICGTNMKKKLKIYDGSKHRVEGTDSEDYAKGGMKCPRKSTKSPAKNNWRTTHEEFISASTDAKMAEAYVAQGGKISDLPSPPPASNPDYVQCPHCSRKFNKSAAERHIPKCSSYQFNKPKGSAKGKAAERFAK